MVLSRATAIVVALCSAALITGCGESGPGSRSESGGPTAMPTPTRDAATAWADSVCSASTELRKSVQEVGEALKVNSSGSTTSLDQARTQVRDRVATVQQSAASLDSTLSAVPAGTDPELQAAQQQLKTASQRAQDKVGQLGAAAAQLADASTPPDTAASLVTMKAALTGTANDLASYRESLHVTVNGGTQVVRDAFGSAPACQDLTASTAASP
jgi:hypothetical protein